MASKKLNLKNSLLIKTIQNFKGLKYRQQIIFKKKYLTIINDSKSTSFSSSIGLLKINIVSWKQVMQQIILIKKFLAINVLVTLQVC